jgi:hypothetical protein
MAKRGRSHALRSAAAFAAFRVSVRRLDIAFPARFRWFGHAVPGSRAVMPARQARAGTRGSK